MRILVVSPIASHPQNQGNSARIFAMCRQLQALGHSIHFLYYPLEGLTPDQDRDMSACWDYFHTLPCDLPNTEKTLGEFYGIDDWYDPRLGEYAAQLNDQWNFDMVWVNYVWFSAVLDSLPDSVYKVIDAHDVFGNRHLRFTEVGLDPEWFYTTVEEELHGLIRANMIIAIQDEEEAYFRDVLKASSTEVITLGYIIPPRFSARKHQRGKPTIGYLGSGNPFNVSSIKDFVLALQGSPAIQQEYRFVLAGTICDKITNLPPFEIMGRLDDLDDFYKNVDIVINPMIGGTGLKIKTLEALSCGVSFIGTESAFAGIPICRADNSQLSSKRAIAEIIALFPNSSNGLQGEDAQLTFLSYISTHAVKLQEILIKVSKNGNLRPII